MARNKISMIQFFPDSPRQVHITFGEVMTIISKNVGCNRAGLVKDLFLNGNYGTFNYEQGNISIGVTTRGKRFIKLDLKEYEPCKFIEQ